MSIRFSIPQSRIDRAKIDEWLKKNAQDYYIQLRIEGYCVDFVHEEDAAMFALAFQVKRQPSKLELMIAREEGYERMSEWPEAWGRNEKSHNRR